MLRERMEERRKHDRRKGFTLVELMIVIAIIAILAAVAIPQYSKYKKTAKITAAKSNCKTAKDAIARYYELEAESMARGVNIDFPTANELVSQDLDQNAKSPINVNIVAFEAGNIGDFTYNNGTCNFNGNIGEGQVIIAADPTDKKYAVACEYTGDGQVDEVKCFGDW